MNPDSVSVQSRHAHQRRASLDWTADGGCLYVRPFATPQNLGLFLCPGEGAMLEVILQNAGGQGWADRAFLSFYGAHDFSTADDFRF